MTVGLGLCDKVAVGDFPIVVRPDEQIFATLALVRTGQANVADKAEKCVVNRAQDRPCLLYTSDAADDLYTVYISGVGG